jgi:uncharacterized tellurite resistance protein B-like protein
MGFLDKFIKQLKPGKSEGTQTDPNFSDDMLTIEKKLEDLPPEKAQFLAAYALLLGRVAYADHEITRGEKEKMKKALIQNNHLSDDQAQMVMGIAVEKTLQTSMESHLVTRKLNELTNKDQKKEILFTLFEIATDEDVSEVESEEIKSIASSFGFSHTEFISVRSKFREHLSVLKK